LVTAFYNYDMHRISDAIVNGGKVVLSDLPFPDGQHVRVVVEEADADLANRVSIDEVRRLLEGGVERFDDPFEPMIPPESWEMLK
jgi:hypothetical protein